MSAKHAFFGIFQKLTLFCCAIFFGFANAFSANLPSGYTELEYIESTGTQYIDTDIYFDFAKNFKVNGRFYNPDASKRKIILGNYSGGGVLNIELKADPAYFRTYFTASTTVDVASNVAMPVNELVSYNVNYDAVSHKSTTIVNGSSFVADIPASSAVASNPLRFFLDWRTPNTVIANPIGIGKTEIYKDDVLVGDFVPAKNSSGVVGMYDTVNNRFYTNAGTGEFTAGRAVCSNGELAQTYTTATGTVTQSGTPTPTNPIEPTFYQQGYMVLRKVGDIADSYDATTGKITRRVGVKVFNGDEEWNTYATGAQRGYYIGVAADIGIKQGVSLQNQGILSSHFNYYKWTDNTTAMPTNSIGLNISVASGSTTNGNMTIKPDMSVFPTIETWKTWLSQNPITVYYQLATETTEDWAPEQCSNGIKIATTAYNTARFSPVVNDLNSTIATIRDVVTNTINQTKAIADLQAKKQTRPDEQCPAGKKCLLVEDNDGTPHWYEIIENVYGLPTGYTPLEYIQSDGASYLIVPYRVNNKTVFYCRYNTPQNTLSAAVIFGVTNEPSVSQANNGILRLIGSGYNRMGWGNSASGSTINVNAPKEFNTWYEVLYDQNKLYQNNTLYATSATQPSTSWTANYDLGIFARNGSSVTYASEAKISSVWAKENGEYKINLVPAKRNSDNVIGMYDLVNDVFYTNSGTGTFTGKEF